MTHTHKLYIYIYTKHYIFNGNTKDYDHDLRLGLFWCGLVSTKHDDVIKWKHFPRYWPFVRGIHRSPVNFPHKGQWRGTLMFSLICARINCWVNNREAGDLRRHRTHYDVIVMTYPLQGYFTGARATIRLIPYQWSNILWVNTSHKCTRGGSY